MKIYPESAAVQLEFDKVKSLLQAYCKTAHAKDKAENLRIHTRKEFIELELQQSYEYKLLLQQAQYFPHDFVLNISRDIQLLGIAGGVLSGEQFIAVRKLAENTEKIFRWFDNETKTAYPALAKVIAHTHYEKKIIALIDEVLDEQCNVKDNA